MTYDESSRFGYSGSNKFGFGASPFMFWQNPSFRRDRGQYISMLEKYKKELGAELIDVEKELERLKQGD